MGKLTINGSFSIAMLVYQRVNGSVTIAAVKLDPNLWSLESHSDTKSKQPLATPKYPLVNIQKAIENCHS